MCYTKQLRFFTMAMLTIVLSLAGCAGDDGTNGTNGTSGADGISGIDGIDGIDPAVVDALYEAQNVGPESCVICHDDGSIALSGPGHQADYDQYYQDQALRVINLAYSYDGTNDIVTFEMTKKNEVTGVEEDFNCLDATTNDPDLPSDALNIYFTQYTGTAFEMPSDGGTNPDPDGDRLSIKGTLTYLGAGVCQSTKAQTTFGGAGALGDLSLLDGHIAVYGRDETLAANSAKHISNPKFPFATILKFNADTYVSNANASACEACHTDPFLKHAYIYGEVSDGTNNDGNDFYVCKVCHLDNGSGGHQDWQLLADDEEAYAIQGGVLTAEQKAKYAYKTRLMNDVHMSHNMEFGFPQSMKNCNTCHAGKLATTLTDANYTAETCISCHAIDNLIAKMQAFGSGIHNPYVLDPDPVVRADTLKATQCNSCHKPILDGGIGPVFSAIHNGFDAEIYADATGLKYSEAFIVDVDVANDTTSFDPVTNILTIKFSATQVSPVAGLAVTDIVPTVMVGPYGYDTKHYIVAPHGRDADRNRLLEYTVGDVHPRFTTVSDVGGVWVVTADMSMWADMIADGTIKRVEIGVMPVLDDLNGDEVAMNAPSRTFDLGANNFDDAYFPDVINVMPGIRNAGTPEEEAYTGCNTCHDALATSFHSGKRGGNIKICKMCHVPSSGGSHLEMQSRSIDSYVHAIHSFQVFDIGDIDESDPVEALEHQHKIQSEFPKFGIMNCEACHNPGMYGVPDQSKSLPGVLSASDDVADRNIGTVPSVVTGPAARACGACHRAEMIKVDDAGKLAAFNEHTKVFGYRVENGDGVWDAVVEKIMSLF